MINQLEQRHFNFDYKNLFWSLTFVIFGLISLTIFQDFVHSIRNNYSFYFTESLLFKVFWLLFLPIMFLFEAFYNQKRLPILIHSILAITTLSLIHLLLIPFVVWGLSTVFFSHSYGYFKVFTYTLSNDFYKLFLVYGAFIFYCNYIKMKTYKILSKSFSENKNEQPVILETILINNGRNYVNVTVSEIFYLAAATPYISIHLESKRYLHQETLKSISEKLDKNNFVRIHKSTIVNLNQIVSFKSRLNGDYDLVLKNNEELRLSRNYVDNFRKKFGNTPQVKL